MTTVSLSDLPHDHPLRNTELVKIGAQYRLRATAWKQITPSWAIKGRTYNDLSPLWTDGVDWRAKVEDQDTKP